MTFTKILGAALLCNVTGVALACELPKLVLIPAKEDTVGKEEAIRAEVSAYFQGMQVFTKCVQDELTAAGENAAPLTKAVLVQRNNVAVAEAQAVLKIFTANVAPAAPVSPGPSPQPPASN